MQIKELTIKEFKDKLLSYYIELFPRQERKPFFILENNVKKGLMKILGIYDEEIEEIVGFQILTFSENPIYAYLEYFAILPQYQSKGYGSKSLDLLKEYSKQYEGIVLEIESIGKGKNEEENEIRKRRQKFYEKNGFEALDTRILLFNQDFTVYLFPKKESITDVQILEKLKKIYIKSIGKEKADKNFKYL